MTPADYAGRSFVDADGPGGPTDRGQREATCRWKATLPKQSACVDCDRPPLPAVFLGGVEIALRGFS